MPGAAGIRNMVLHTVRGLRGKPAIELSPGCRVVEYGQPGFDTFFGYHDVTPFRADGRLLLATRRRAGIDTAAGTQLDAGIFDLSSPAPVFEPFTSTTAWCWQQGCRLQWYPSADKACVFFNVSHRGRHEGRVFDVARREVTQAIDRAIYSVSASGDMGVSLNFARLQRLRPGYGYDDVADATRHDAAPIDDGLWLVNLRTGNNELALSLAEVAAFDPHPSMADAVHYFNHILWSPGSKRFFFIHLWHGRDAKRRGRAFIWDVESSAYWPLGPREHVSHHCWLDDERLVVFSTEPQSGMCYHLYHYRDGCRDVVGRGILNEDGHPSPCPANPSILVTDTYPNATGEQSLLTYDMADGTVQRIGHFFSPLRFRGEKRCDLHPRWDATGERIAVDSAHGGERRLCVVHMR